MGYVNVLNPFELQIHAMGTCKAWIIEDRPICSKRNIFGHFLARRRQMTICMSRIQAIWQGDARRMINEALMHEFVHLSQACRDRSGYLIAPGMKRSTMLLISAKKTDLRKALAYDPYLSMIEHEAFCLDGKSEKVRYIVQRCCF